MSDNIRLLGKVLSASNINKITKSYRVSKNSDKLIIKKQVNKGDLLEIEEIEKDYNLNTYNIFIHSDNIANIDQDVVFDFITSDLNKNLNNYLIESPSKLESSLKWFKLSKDDGLFKYWWQSFLFKVGYLKENNIDDLIEIISNMNDDFNLIASPLVYSYLKSSSQFEPVKKLNLKKFNDIFLAGRFGSSNVYVNPLSKTNDIFFFKNMSLIYNDFVDITEIDNGLRINLNYLFESNNVRKLRLLNY